MKYGNKRDYKKIDLFTKGKGICNQWVYYATTTWAKTCKEAKQRFITEHQLDSTQVKAKFQK